MLENICPYPLSEVGGGPGEVRGGFAEVGAVGVGDAGQTGDAPLPWILRQL